jgi:hypothetical protein
MLLQLTQLPVDDDRHGDGVKESAFGAVMPVIE